MKQKLRNCFSFFISGIAVLMFFNSVESAYSGLEFLPSSFHSRAYDVSGDGSTTVGTSGFLSSGSEAFRWTQSGGMVGLSDLPGGGTWSTAFGVSSDGSVVVGRGRSDSGSEAFRWTQSGGMVGLGDLPGGDFYSEAYGASGDGSVVVGHGKTASGAEAFIWDKIHGMRSLQDVLKNIYGLDLAGWQLTVAWDISADGSIIVGAGNNPDGNHEAWIAKIDLPQFIINDIIDFINAQTDIVGIGSGNSANNKYNAFMNMLLTVADLIEAGNNSGACGLLNSIINKCDGMPAPLDFIVDGTGALMGMLDDLTTSLGCE